MAALVMPFDEHELDLSEETVIGFPLSSRDTEIWWQDKSQGDRGWTGIQWMALLSLMSNQALSTL